MSDEYSPYDVRDPATGNVKAFDAKARTAKKPKKAIPKSVETDEADSPTQHGVSVGQLRSICERIERLEEEKKAISHDIREVFAEAKANGFDVKALRAIIRLRKKEPTEREEEEAVLELYKSALGL